MFSTVFSLSAAYGQSIKYFKNICSFFLLTFWTALVSLSSHNTVEVLILYCIVTVPVKSGHEIGGRMIL